MDTYHTYEILTIIAFQYTDIYMIRVRPITELLVFIATLQHGTRVYMLCKCQGGNISKHQVLNVRFAVISSHTMLKNPSIRLTIKATQKLLFVKYKF